jgi:peptidoglycan/xylan/chitin deacetylase (PgdA/CDA1 family)
MLRGIKSAAYRAAKAGGVFALAGASPWRRHRLAILCYHGVALLDEHRWDPKLYITVDLLRRRLETLRRLGCAILPLGEAVERLRAGSLPPRSVVLTFDDGYYDFYRQALPVLREFGAPATVYVTTYYSQLQRPIFPIMLSYLLWKGLGRTLDWPEVLRDPVDVTPENRGALWSTIHTFVGQAGYSGREKDALLANLAGRLALDYEDLCARRLLQVMNAGELGAAQGADLQLHTHRHHTPRTQEQFAREIEDNRRVLGAAAGGNDAFRHFCYPSGAHHEESAALLRNCGILSATTCDTGLASQNVEPLRLPRYCDSMLVPDIYFEAWVTGAADLLPHRNYRYKPELNPKGA